MNKMTGVRLYTCHRFIARSAECSFLRERKIESEKGKNGRK